MNEDDIVREMVRYYGNLVTRRAKVEYVHHIKNSQLALKFAKAAGIDLGGYR